MATSYIPSDEVLLRASRILHKCKSLRYLKAVVTHPHQSFHPIVLRHGEQLEYYCNEMECAIKHKQFAFITCTEPDGKHPIVDKKTVADCIKHLAYLRGMIEQAKEDRNYAKLEDLTTEQYKVLNYLVHSVDKNGKPYSFDTMRQRDYKSIRIAFDRMQTKIRPRDKELALYIKEHLDMDKHFLWRE